MFEDKTSDFDNDSGAKTLNGFRQQALDIASGILKAVKRAFDMFTNAVEQSVKFGWILQRLVGTFGGPDAVACVLANVGLPIGTDKAFINKEVAVPKTTSASSPSSVKSATKSYTTCKPSKLANKTNL